MRRRKTVKKDKKNFEEIEKKILWIWKIYLDAESDVRNITNE